MPSRLSKLSKPFGCALDVGQKALGGQRVLVGLVKVCRIVFNGFCKMLLERGRTRERRRIQPARHSHDHGGAKRHDAEHGGAARMGGDMRIEAGHIGPKGVDSDRDRSRVDDRSKEHRSRRAI
ncbi:hypothetical protein FQZ97_731320 [compost metagenome]